MSIKSYHFAGCTFPVDGCICASIQRDIDAGNREPQPRDDIRVFRAPKKNCAILDYAAPGAPVPGAPVVPIDTEGSNSPASISTRKTGKSDMQREAIQPRHYQAAAILSAESHNNACRELLARMFPGADLRYVGPLINVNQEAPPQNRYTARFGFPFNRFEGRGPDELDAYEALYTSLYNMWEKHNRDPQSVHRTFTQNYMAHVEHDEREAIIPLAELEKARKEAAAALAPEEPQNEHKAIDLKDEWAINPEAWPAPEAGPMETVGGIFYNDSCIAAKGDRPADISVSEDQAGNKTIEVKLPQGNPAFVRGYEFVAGSYSFVCTTNPASDAAKIDSAFGNWYPLVRLAAYEKLQETVKRLTENLLTEQQETAAAEEREAKAKAEVARLRELSTDNTLISHLVAEIEAKLAMRGDTVVRAGILDQMKRQVEQRNYLASQSLVVLWRDRRPYVAKIENDGQVRGMMETVAICGYEAGAPVTFDNVDIAIASAMQILPPVKQEG